MGPEDAAAITAAAAAKKKVEVMKSSYGLESLADKYFYCTVHPTACAIPKGFLLDNANLVRLKCVVCRYEWVVCRFCSNHQSRIP